MRNFRERQNGEINVDYDHASEMPEVAAGGPIPSAGRIVGIDPPEKLQANSELRIANREDDSPLATRHSRSILWGWFEPTERARTLVRNSEYRYISPAIDWGAKNKRTGKPQGATLTSVALTNRPFLEEMPQIRLSDPGYRLVDATAGTTDAASPRALTGQGGGAASTGGSMKKVQLSVADGKIKVQHPDLADEYYADPEDAVNALAALGSQPDAEPDAGDAEVPMAQAASVLSEAEARGKSIPAVEVFRARVEQALDDAVRSRQDPAAPPRRLAAHCAGGLQHLYPADVRAAGAHSAAACGFLRRRSGERAGAGEVYGGTAHEGARGQLRAGADGNRTRAA